MSIEVQFLRTAGSRGAGLGDSRDRVQASELGEKLKSGLWVGGTVKSQGSSGFAWILTQIHLRSPEVSLGAVLDSPKLQQGGPSSSVTVMLGSRVELLACWASTSLVTLSQLEHWEMQDKGTN